VIRLQNGKRRIRDAILGMGDGFYLLQRVQAGCGAHSARIKWVTEVNRHLGINLITHLQIVARLRMCGAIRQLAFMSVNKIILPVEIW